jgi:nucleotidyltransferase/DNA polymerase involved in DNA repair
LFFPGIAANTMLAKVCSDKNKPNGQFAVERTRQAVCDFVQNLPIRKVRRLSLYDVSVFLGNYYFKIHKRDNNDLLP